MLVLRRGANDRNDTHETTRDPDTRLEHLAADLTSAVYPLLLRRGLTGSWVQVQLALWKALSGAVKEWAPRRRPTASSREFDAWREGLLADLTERASSIARNNGIQGPLLEVEQRVQCHLPSVAGRSAGERLTEAGPTTSVPG